MSRPETSNENNGKNVINTGGGAYIAGRVNTGGGDFVGRDQTNTGLSAAEIKNLFAPIYENIDTKPQIPPQDKADLKVDVQEIEAEVAKGEEANESFLERRFRNIGRMAPDILDVVLTTLANPTAGFAMTVTKIANKAKASENS